MSIRFHLEAHAELLEAARWYDLQRAGSGGKFLRAIYSAAVSAAQHPLRANADQDGFRRRTIKPYPYWLVYEAHPTYIMIFAVSHHRRDPAYWVNRIH